MKELPQNADDAKATKVCFINDPRQHPDERVFEESWKPLQGPALCVYNNAPFTKSDIQGIQNLGEGNKGDDPNKTGQYGVGFNAVYHLTDAPTFISQGEEIGEVMCVFDPNLTFAPGADESSPGVMFKDLPALRKKFPDVFPCYLRKHFPIANGTMFRFPLRNEEMARKSKICETPIKTEDLSKLFDSFKKEMFHVLLFVNNVKEISVCEVNKRKGNITKKYSVKALLSKEDEENRRHFAARVNKIGKHLQRKEMSISDIPVHQVSYVVNLEDSEGLNQKWFVVQKIGFENPKEIPDAVIKAFNKGDLGLLPRGGVASLISSSEKNPGKAFCFLPLPFETGLPVHINGHFALDHEARRNLWRDERGDEYRSNWNNALLRHVIAPCYVTVLDEVRKYIFLPSKMKDTKCKVKNVLSNYVHLFPVSMDVQEDYWKTLCKEVYRLMNSKALRLLPVLYPDRNTKKTKTVVKIKWLPPTGEGRDKAFFDNLAEESKDEIEDIESKRQANELQKEEVLRETLLNLGFNLLCMPMRIYKCFKDSNVDVDLISPADVVRFFRTYSTPNQLCNIGNLPSKIKDTQFKCTSNLLSVVNYCKKDESFLQGLDGLPLLLTEDKSLRVFDSSNPVYQSCYFDLFPHSSHEFLHHAFLSFMRHFKACSVFKDLDVVAFANLLPLEVNDVQYKTTGSCVLWPQSMDSPTQIPNKKWIIRAWQFLSCYIHTCGLTNPSQVKKMKDRLLCLLSPLSNWCLLPAFEDKQHILVPVGMSDTVIDLQSCRESDLGAVLQNLHVPQLNHQLLNEVESAMEMTRQLVASPNDPNAVLTVLYTKLKSKFSFSKNVVDQDCKTVAEYFSKNARHLDTNSTEQLMMLPIYRAIHGKYISVYGKRVFVLSKKFPKAEMHIWEETSGIAFLEGNSTLEELYRFLQCVSKDKVDVYCDIIFERFQEMSEGARLEHMKFVREIMKTVEAKSSDDERQRRKLEKLRRVLSELKFIPSFPEGTLTTASSFYDPSHEVYKVLLQNKQGKFPPAPYSNDDWLDFLRKIGMVHDISKERFALLAKEVEAEARTNRTETTRLKSETLVKYLLRPENRSKIPFEEIKEVCFMHPYEVRKLLQEIQLQPSSQMESASYVCFKGSVAKPRENEFLVWTSANLLPDEANSMEMFDFGSSVAQSLEVLVKPSVDMVVTHCTNICSALWKKVSTANGYQSEIMEIMTSIYTFLRKNYNGNEDSIKKLKKVPCIMVEDGQKFVFPTQVVVDINSEQELRPYLYKIPNEVAPFAELFKQLGTTNTITSAHYANILKDMHAEFGNNPLHPNETKQVLKATKGFFETIEKEDSETKISVLILPAVMKGNLTRVFLRKSTDIYYDDAPHFKERLDGFNNLLLIKLEECGLKVSNKESLMNKLPESIRPCKLTSEVHECLIENSQTMSCYGTARELEQLLTSGNFCNGLIRLIKQGNKERGLKIMSSEDVADIRQQLKCIRVHSVPVLQTELLYNGNTIPESKRKVTCFEQQDEEGFWKIYVKAAVELKGYSSKVAQVVDRITGNRMNTMLIHLPEMLSLNPSEIKSFLDGLGIYEDDTFFESQTTCLPTPGTFIHISDHHLLVDDFTVFSAGEYVGYELDDPSLRGEDGTPTYIYAVVIEEVIEDGQPSNIDPSLRKYN